MSDRHRAAPGSLHSPGVLSNQLATTPRATTEIVIGDAPDPIALHGNLHGPAFRRVDAVDEQRLPEIPTSHLEMSHSDGSMIPFPLPPATVLHNNQSLQYLTSVSQESIQPVR